MPHPGPLLLLPPSEGKSTGGSGPAWQPGDTSWPALDDRRLAVGKALRAAMRKPVASRTKLLGVKGAALAQATATNLAVAESPTQPAIDRYTGVLYDELDALSLPAAARRRFGQQVVIFSGLFGIVRPGDLIPDYKLKMGATIGRPGKLSTWWRGPITDALAGEIAERTVWDLLPNEHRAAWTPAVVGSRGGPTRIITARFLDEQRPAGRAREGELVAVAHWNKLLKGSLVRHVIKTQLEEVDGLVDFDHPRGYRFRPDRTTVEDGRIIATFVRPFDSDEAKLEP